VLVDSHCHLADEAFAADRPAVLDRAWQAQVGHVVVIGDSSAAAALGLSLAAATDKLSITAGVHPHNASGWNAGAEAWLRDTLPAPTIVALGEIGLDYHYDHSPRDVQRRAFEAQLAIAGEHRLPAVVHAREADADVAAILGNHPSVTAILHSFSSGMELLHAGLDLGHYVSFSGMVTFRNWRLDDAVRMTPVDRLLVETDAPYLAPEPFRGKRNEPAFVRQVADRLARVRGMTPDDLIAATGENARRVFGARLGRIPVSPGHANSTDDHHLS